LDSPPVSKYASRDHRQKPMVRARKQLTDSDRDAGGGAETIAWHLRDPIASALSAPGSLPAAA